MCFQLNENLVNTISNIMETDQALLDEAQQRSKACSRFVPKTVTNKGHLGGMMIWWLRTCQPVSGLA